MDKIAFSANFKKDYIAYLAIVIFFLILSFEIFMAIFIPAHLHIEGVWSKEVARQQMIDRFDYTRKWFEGLSSWGGNTQEEAEIISDSLTPLAEYLREHQYQLGFEEIKAIDDIISDLPKFREHIKKGTYSVELKLKSDKFMQTLAKDMKAADK